MNRIFCSIFARVVSIAMLAKLSSPQANTLSFLAVALPHRALTYSPAYFRGKPALSHTAGTDWTTSDAPAINLSTSTPTGVLRRSVEAMTSARSSSLTSKPNYQKFNSVHREYSNSESHSHDRVRVFEPKTGQAHGRCQRQGEWDIPVWLSSPSLTFYLSSEPCKIFTRSRLRGPP
jgi:hypothetical protein